MGQQLTSTPWHPAST